MRIAMMGSGGIGGYLGARLAQAGEDVIFIARGAHLEAMQRNGLRVESPLGEIILRHVRANETPVDIGFVDIVVFAVKANDTERAGAAIVPLVGPATRVVTLQNGIDSVNALARTVPRSQVVGGATYLSAHIERPGVIVHLGSVTQVVVGGRDDAMIEAWRGACVRAGGIDLETVEDIDQVLWTKYVTVSAFSGATSLMRAGIGPILADPEARIFLEQLRDEGMAVASAAGRPMPEGYKEFAIAKAATRDALVNGQRPRPRQADRTLMAVGTHARARERAWRADSRTYGGLSRTAFVRRRRGAFAASSDCRCGARPMMTGRDVGGDFPSPGCARGKAGSNCGLWPRAIPVISFQARGGMPRGTARIRLAISLQPSSGSTASDAVAPDAIGLRASWINAL